MGGVVGPLVMGTLIVYWAKTYTHHACSRTTGHTSRLTHIHVCQLGRKTERKKKKEAVGRTTVDMAEEGSAKYKLKRLSNGPHEI